MYCSLNFVKGAMQGFVQRSTIGVIQGDSRSLGYGSHVFGLLEPRLKP